MPDNRKLPDWAEIKGLSEKEAAGRLAAEGYNELPTSKKRSLFTIALGVIREPMFLLLIGGGIIYLLLGDIEEALSLMGFVFVIMGITLYQERKTERTLEALRDMSSPRALVIRDGEQKRIVGREVVRGDILILNEGDRVPADALVLSCVDLSADESLLTGESVPVRKVPCQDEASSGPPGGDDLPIVFAGTLIVHGQGIARVEAIGSRTEMGKIGKQLEAVVPEQTILHRETGRLVRNLAILGISLSTLLVVIFGFTRNDWLHALLAGITLGMAILPEEFPVVLTIFLALGAWRIARERVLTRQSSAIESFGSATVLCVDKTGTLTVNRMTVSGLFAQNRFYSLSKPKPDQLPEAFHELVEYSILASESNPSDPMEKAFRELGETYLNHTEHLHKDWSLMGDYHFTSNYYPSHTSGNHRKARTM